MWGACYQWGLHWTNGGYIPQIWVHSIHGGCIGQMGGMCHKWGVHLWMGVHCANGGVYFTNGGCMPQIRGASRNVGCIHKWGDALDKWGYVPQMGGAYHKWGIPQMGGAQSKWGSIPERGAYHKWGVHWIKGWGCIPEMGGHYPNWGLHWMNGGALPKWGVVLQMRGASTNGGWIGQMRGAFFKWDHKCRVQDQNAWTYLVCCPFPVWKCKIAAPMRGTGPWTWHCRDLSALPPNFWTKLLNKMNRNSPQECAPKIGPKKHTTSYHKLPISEKKWPSKKKTFWQQWLSSWFLPSAFFRTGKQLTYLARTMMRAG